VVSLEKAQIRSVGLAGKNIDLRVRRQVLGAALIVGFGKVKSFLTISSGVIIRKT
jgi:hypothetical protein